MLAAPFASIAPDLTAEWALLHPCNCCFMLCMLLVLIQSPCTATAHCCCCCCCCCCVSDHCSISATLVACTPLPSPAAAPACMGICDSNHPIPLPFGLASTSAPPRPLLQHQTNPTSSSTCTNISASAAPPLKNPLFLILDTHGLHIQLWSFSPHIA